MNDFFRPILIDPDNVFAFILAICSAIITIAAVVGIFSKVVSKSHQAVIEQEQRVGKIEKRITKMEKYLKNDYDAIQLNKDVDRILMKSQLALLSHLINGDSIDKMNEAKNELEEFLIKK